MAQPDRTLARRLAAESLARGDAVGWFDALYRVAGGNAAAIPWADLGVNPNLASWLEKQPAAAAATKALVVGCGLGDDAEFLAARGFRVTAFDVSPTAIGWCRQRFPDSPVVYLVADALDPPTAWRGAFDFVFEAYTLQVLPPQLRPQVIRAIAACVALGGTLLVVARARESAEEQGTMPWPLVKNDLDGFSATGLEAIAFEEYLDGEDPPARRFRVTYRRAQ